MIYYTKKKTHINIKKDNKTVYSSKLSIQSIMFLSKLLKSIKMHYWSTELELADMMWVIWKIRHLIELLNLVTIIYINYKINVEIIKQILLFIMSTEKLNLQLIQVSEYLQCFNLNICHKSENNTLFSIHYCN